MITKRNTLFDVHTFKAEGFQILCVTVWTVIEELSQSNWEQPKLVEPKL